MPKPVNVHVTTADAELEFTIQTVTKGKEFFDRVVKAIGVREVWYFGLLFTDSAGLPCWLNLDKKIMSQDIRKETPIKFQFLAKYFPEDVSEELILYHTKLLFFLQVKNSILADEYYCPAETAVLLASFAVQAKFGDYKQETYKPEILENEQLLPPRVIKQHSLTKADWDERVLTWYKEHNGKNKEMAIVEYLKIAQDLEMYGINYFEITNKKGTKLWLGVDALGINIYDHEDKLTPKIGFPWSEVRNVSYSGKKFVVKPSDRTAPDFIFMAPKPKINKQILGLCMGNYELYTRRRKPDSVEVQQMKNQAKEENLIRETERQQMLREKEQREEKERQNRELEERLQLYLREMETSKEDLERSQQTAHELEQKLMESKQNTIELMELKLKAEEARKLAEEAADSEKAEKELKEREANYAQILLEKKAEEIHEKELEAKLLQEELEQARIIISQRSLLDSLSGSSSPTSDFNKVQIVIKQNSEVCHEDNSDQESKEFRVDYELINKHEEDRIRMIDADMKTSEQLQVLRKELEKSKVENQVTKNDLIYVKNVKQGRDKYKTLKQIRQGNTKIRVELFESL